MDVIVPGKHYRVSTIGGLKVDIVFFHTSNGAQVDGITSEELMRVLIDRHGGYARSVATAENLNVHAHLEQARVWMGKRRESKKQRKLYKRKLDDGKRDAL